MNSQARILLVLALSASPAVLAQKWEFGGGGGGGFYTSKDITAPSGSAKAKFSSNIAASGWLANNNTDFWGGELRYDYQRGDAQLTSGSEKATFAAQSHAVHYDFLLHFAPRKAPVRPFVAFGGGMKIYQGTGKEVVYQPLNRIGLLTKTSETLPLISVGAGVKINVSNRIGFRADVHDYLTPFPEKVIAASSGAKVGGWIHDIVATFGISLIF